MIKKKIIITGVLGGIGRVIASLFKNNGWYVIGMDLDSTKNYKFVDEFYALDLSNQLEIKNFCQQIAKKHEIIGGLVNNAAVQITKNILKTSIEEWDKIFAVNVRAAFLLTKFLRPLLKTSHGSIVNVSSVHAIVTSKNIAAYAASKGALSALTRAMALDLAEDKIRVNAILPGAVDTTMLRRGLNRGHLEGKNIDVKMQKLADRHVLGKVGLPKDIAQLIFFLISNNYSSFITGQNFVIDGGATIRLSTE